MSERQYPLRVLFWEATLKCNAFCEFCGSRCGERSTENELTKEEICSVFAEIAERYDPSKIMINVSGGEPLMRRDLFEIMSFADRLGYKWGMVTNGTLLDEERILGLKKSRIRTISVSIDGPEEVHDRIRSFPGSFKKIVQNIKKLSEIRTLETVMVTTVVSKHNLSWLPNICELLCKLPVQVWRIGPVDPIGRASEQENLLLDAGEMRQLFAFIKECRRSSLPFQTVTSCSHYLGDYELALREHFFQCVAGKQMASILADGDIYVCSNVPKIPSLVQGNVRKNSFAEVWERGFEYFRNPESRRKGKCAGCEFFPQCQADSLHTWDFEREKPKFCMLDYGLKSSSKGSEVTELKAAGYQEIISRYKKGKEKIKALQVKAQSLSPDRIIFSPEAFRKVQEIFLWGQECEGNRTERIACLTGRLYRNSEISAEAFLVEVRAAAELKAEDAGETHMKVNPEWVDQGRSLAACCQKQDEILLGFIHSHPGNLSVAMSLGDYQWHKNLYFTDWRMALSVIINPGKKEIAAYTGPAANHSELTLLFGIERKNDIIVQFVQK